MPCIESRVGPAENLRNVHIVLYVHVLHALVLVGKGGMCWGTCGGVMYSRMSYSSAFIQGSIIRVCVAHCYSRAQCIHDDCAGAPVVVSLSLSVGLRSAISGCPH